MRILLVEDDELLGDGLRRGLEQAGYTVSWLTDGEEASHTLKDLVLNLEEIDLIVLDIGLPRRSGLDILRELRAKNNKTPVLILTARDGVQDRITGLDLGADDYLTKPFDLDELCARLRALQRRLASRASPTLNYGPLTLDPKGHTVTLNGNPLSIPRREFKILQKLLENVGQVLTRDALAQTIYGWDDEVDSNTIEVHIHNLRKKLGGEFIRTIRGIGYMAEKL